jgi:hypothetical protein
MKGKMTPQKLLLHPHKAPAEVRKLFDEIDSKPERNELNLYVTGYEDEPEAEAGKDTESGAGKNQGQPESEGAGARQPSSQREGSTGGEG